MGGLTSLSLFTYTCTGELFEDAEREQKELGPKSKLHLIILDEASLCM
jgi:hypothetical protein